MTAGTPLRIAGLAATGLLAACLMAAAAPASRAATAAGPSAWARSANAICEKTKQRISSIERGGSNGQIASGLEKILALVVRQNHDLAKLKRPTAQRADIAKLLGYYNVQVGYVRGMIAGLRKNDLGAVNAWTAKGSAVNDTATALAGRLGASSC